MATPAAPVQLDLVPLLVAFITAFGGGAGIVKLVDGLLKIRAGMSVRESKRKVDIVQQRDIALAERDTADEQRREVQEYAARLRRQLIEHGIEPGAEPTIGRTITRSELKELRESEEP